MTPDQIEEGWKTYQKTEVHGNEYLAFKAGVEFAERCHSLTEEKCIARPSPSSSGEGTIEERFEIFMDRNGANYMEDLSNSDIAEFVKSELALSRPSPKMTETSVLSENDCLALMKGYMQPVGNTGMYFLNHKDVITLLMEHSNPSPVLEEVKKFVKIMMNRERNAEAMDAYRGLLSFITELSKGKV